MCREQGPAATAGLFNNLAARYDAWYDGPAGRVVFPMEVDCLEPLLAGLPRPWLEVGVGSGRFAHALKVEYGIDPAGAPLQLAALRNVRSAQAIGERLPFRDGTFGAVLIVVTICFADDPQALLVEARRILKDNGGIVIGEVFADSRWGEYYQARGADGHPFYSVAHFLTRADTWKIVHRADLQLSRTRSTLRQPPSEVPVPETAVEGDDAAAGFTGMLLAPARPIS